MNELLLEPLRFIVLAGLLLFIVRTIQVMQADLRASGSPLQHEPPAPLGPRTNPTGDAAAPEPQPVALARSEPLLVVETGTADIAAGQTFPVHGELVIGRSPASHLVLSDRFVSARHAQLALRDGAVWIRDLGSSNGTFVNDHRLTEPAALANGDRLRVGRIVLRLQWPRI